MKILAHRGLWLEHDEKNTIVAIERAFAEGFGIETDIRDLNGRIVISHDPPNETSPKLEEVLELYCKYRKNTGGPVMALNVKADGLYMLLNDILTKYVSVRDYYLFDMSVPEQYVYINKGYNVYARSSEYESEPVLLDRSVGIWLDQFTDCDHIERVLGGYLSKGISVSVISPEIHGREKNRLWDYLRQYMNSELLSLCTDRPIEAREFFDE